MGNSDKTLGSWGLLVALGSVAVVAGWGCGSDDGDNPQYWADGGTGGGGGSDAGTGGAGGSSGSETGGTGGGDTGGSGGATGGSGGATGGSGGSGASGGSGGSGGSSASDCMGDEVVDPLMGSCDTSAVSGGNEGQCRDWYGTGGPDLQVSCDGLSGAYSATSACPVSDRVASCVLDKAAGIQAVYNYYSGSYSESSARSHCGTLGGCVLVPGAFEVAFAGTGSGYVSVDPPGEMCSAATVVCEYSFQPGDSVTLEALPDALSSFTGWTGGGCGTDPVCVVTATSDDHITATFTHDDLNMPFSYAFGSSHQNGDSMRQLLLGSAGELYMGARIWTTADVGGVTVGQGTLFTDFVGRFEPDTLTLSWVHEQGMVLRFDHEDHLIGLLRIDDEPVTIDGQTFSFATEHHVFFDLDPSDGSILSSRSVDLGERTSVSSYEFLPNGDILAAGTESDSSARESIIVMRLAAADASSLWYEKFTDANESMRLLGFAIDAAGDPYAVGEYKTTVSFGGAGLAAPVDRNMFALKLDGSDGSHVWSTRVGEATFRCGIAISDAGDLFLADRNFVRRLSPTDGSAVWSEPMGYNGHVAIDVDGSPIFAGEISADIDLGFGEIVPRGWQDILIAKRDAADGTLLWTKRLGGTGHDRGDVLPVSLGEYYVYGYFGETMEVPGAVLESLGGNYDAMILRVEP